MNDSDRFAAEVIKPANNVVKYLPVERITALWALSEAALGGVMHAFRIPFTGLIINSSAVVFITLIAFYAQNRGAILKATLIVLIIKGTVSPHTPINAFLALSFQGLLGELLFSTRRYFMISAVVLGGITLLQSAIQKLVVLTIIFGNNLWESIDLFGNYVFQQISFLSLPEVSLQLSYWIIGFYVGIHVLCGVLIGMMAIKFPAWLRQESESGINPFKISSDEGNIQININRSRKSWLKKPTGIAIVILTLAIVLLTYVFPQFTLHEASNALAMVFRSIIIMILWYGYVGPKLVGLNRKFLAKKKNRYLVDVQKTVQILPTLRYIVYCCWNDSASHRHMKRLYRFVILTISSILTAELEIK